MLEFIYTLYEVNIHHLYSFSMFIPAHILVRNLDAETIQNMKENVDGTSRRPPLNILLLNVV